MNIGIKKKIISVRTDGLGARLMAMIHGMYVAEHLGLPFKFCWLPMKGDSSFHSISSAESIFSSKFLEKNYETHFDLSRYLEVVNEPLDTEKVKDVVENSRMDGINMMVCSDDLIFLGSPVPRDIFPKMWQRIEFSDRLLEVIKKAKAAVPESAVAIHARRGDTVDGVYRMRLFNDRYIPISWFKTILREEVSRGSNILFFSDDSRMLAMMRERYAIRTTDDLGAAELTSDERAVFDFAIMSQCSRIVGRQSTYAILASLINKVKFDDPRAAFDMASRRMAILDDIERNPDDYTQLDRAKEIQWIANELSEGLTHEQRDQFLVQAQELDPENQTYTHLRALTFARRKQYDLADALLQETATVYFESKGKRTQEFMHPFNLMGDRVAKPFSEPAKIGDYPFLALFYAHNLAKKEGWEAALIVYHRAYLLRPQSDVLLANYVQALMSCGKHEDAIEPLKEAIDSGRNTPIFHRQLAEVFEVCGDKSSAFKHSEIGYRLAPDDPFLRAKYALLLTKARRASEAREVSAGMNADSTNDPAALYQLSRAAAGFGEKVLAKECAHKAVLLRPRKKHYRRWLESL